jgi:hypothetical protein
MLVKLIKQNLPVAAVTGSDVSIQFIPVKGLFDLTMRNFVLFRGAMAKQHLTIATVRVGNPCQSDVAKGMKSRYQLREKLTESCFLFSNCLNFVFRSANVSSFFFCF